MSIFWKVLRVIFISGLVLLGFAYSSVSVSLLEDHKDWIGIVGSFASIAAALVGFFCWLFRKKNQVIDSSTEADGKGNTVNITMSAGNDMVGGNKHETHFHSGKIDRKD